AFGCFVAALAPHPSPPPQAGEGWGGGQRLLAPFAPSPACGGRLGGGRAPQAHGRSRGDRPAPTPTRPARRSAPGVRMACTALRCKQALLPPRRRGREWDRGSACLRLLLLPLLAGEGWDGGARRRRAGGGAAIGLPPPQPVRPGAARLAFGWPARQCR